ncbi:hypothetical protein AAFF_G00058640 [Aldrovandia affinis]|uniref:Uncharacterized protein n=1 Tax=Aldrovandia affinis TaxID=143900 RepID=A0AAD7WEG9_9TELE|nr:hypothetical protein AAFF_G00058640 [Aldrovandia affinis]
MRGKPWAVMQRRREPVLLTQRRLALAQSLLRDPERPVAPGKAVSLLAIQGVGEGEALFGSVALLLCRP